MQIKDVEIITISDLGEKAPGWYRYQKLSWPASFRSESVYIWRPKKKLNLYSNSFGKYKLFCNFSKGKGVAILNQKAENILNFCDGERTIKDIFDILSLRKSKRFQFSDVWNLGKKGISFDEIYAWFSGKEILTLDNLVNIFYLFNEYGLVDSFKVLQASEKNEIINRQKFLDVYFYLTNKSHFGPRSLDGKTETKADSQGAFKKIDHLFNSALGNNQDIVSIKFFIEDDEELALFYNLASFCRRKSMETYIEPELSLFTNWSLVSPSLIKKLRQIRAHLLLPLDNIEGNALKEVEKSLATLEEEKYSPFIITTVTALNLDKLNNLIDYLFDKKLDFVFGFIQNHSGVPANLIPESDKLIKAMEEVYEFIEEKLPPHYLFPNILGRNFRLFSRDRRNEKLQTVIINQEGIKEIDFELERKQECGKCQFKELCLKSSPIITKYFSFEEDNFTSWCQAYKALIPQTFHLEAKRLIKYKSFSK